MTSYPEYSANGDSDIETAHDVKLLVGHFYTRIREDAVLGMIFDDIANVDWVEHIPTMCQFWETVLLHQPGYSGNPLLPHVKLNRLMKNEHNASVRPADFDRWISLFYSTVDELFSGPRSERAKRSAARMAETMISAIANDDNSPFGVIPAGQPSAASRGYQNPLVKS